MTKNNYCTLYIVRHGETEMNVKKVLQGHLDSALTKLGEEQARIRGNSLSHINFDAVFSSDLLRAKLTAEIILLEKKMAVTTKKMLRERSFGSFEGMTFDNFHKTLEKEFADYDKLSEQEKFRQTPHSEIESDENIVSRFITLLREIAVFYTGKTVLVVSHGGAMRALLIHLGFGTSLEVDFGSVHNLGYVKIESDGVDFVIKKTDGIEKKM